MKSLFVFTVGLFLTSIVVFAQDSTKAKQKKTTSHSGKTCTIPVKIKKP